MEKQRLFIDMDGTLCVWRDDVTSTEELYEEGFYRNQVPQTNVLNAVKSLVNSQQFEVFILSAVLTDSVYALKEKQAWLDEYLPCIDNAHRVFTEAYKPKNDHVPGGIRASDVLLDDYTMNLREWIKGGGVGIKLYNGINGTNGTWWDELKANKRFAEYWRQYHVLSRWEPELIAEHIAGVAQDHQNV